jgi:hypothetical protein
MPDRPPGTEPTAVPLPRAGGGWSRAVVLLRWVLPVTALAIMGLLAGWSHLPPAPRAGVAPDPARAVVPGAMQMTAPRYVARLGDRGDRVEVTAASAVLATDRSGALRLATMRATLTPEGAPPLELAAGQGTLDRTAGTLDLIDGIELRGAGGYRLLTERAAVDLTAGSVRGDAAIRAVGPAGHIAADGFLMEDRGAVLRFRGRVRATLDPRPIEETTR